MNSQFGSLNNTDKSLAGQIRKNGEDTHFQYKSERVVITADLTDIKKTPKNIMINFM